MGSGLERAVDDVAIGLEMATGSLLECINAAMEAEGFAPASMGGRTKAMATSADMLEYTKSEVGWGESEGQKRKGRRLTRDAFGIDERGLGVRRREGEVEEK